MGKLLKWIWLCLIWRFYPAMSDELRAYFKKETGPAIEIPVYEEPLERRLAREDLNRG